MLFRKIEHQKAMEREYPLKQKAQTRNPILDGEEMMDITKKRDSNINASENYKSIFQNEENYTEGKRYSTLQTKFSAKKASSTVFDNVSPIRRIEEYPKMFRNLHSIWEMK